MNCPSCGTELSEHDQNCPFCGAPKPQAEPQWAAPPKQPPQQHHPRPSAMNPVLSGCTVAALICLALAFGAVGLCFGCVAVTSMGSSGPNSYSEKGSFPIALIALTVAGVMIWAAIKIAKR